MILIIVTIIGSVLGYTSHIKSKPANKVIGILEGLTVVSAFFWLFYNLNWWRWLEILLAIIAYALYLLIIQSLARQSVYISSDNMQNIAASSTYRY